MFPLITLEEHYIAKSVEALPHVAAEYENFSEHIVTRLRDLGPGRLSEMDAGHVSVQVISHTPSKDCTPDVCKQANNELSAAVSANTTRLAALALLPMAHPEAAVVELERCVKELGFLGALVDNHLDDGTYFDGRRFWPVFEAAQTLDVPIYIHPAFPSENMQGLYRGNYGKAAEFSLGAAGWGWHPDVALHVLRLVAAGLFDEFPRIKIVIGHNGEMLPFQFERVERLSKTWGKEGKTLRQVWDENIWITTSGMFSVNPMACMLRNTKIDRILYSVDWPYAKNEDGVKFLEDLRASGLVTEEQLEMIAYKNAEKLLKISASK